MSDQSPTPSTRPEVVDHATYQAAIDSLRTREKAHMREGDALAAARRRLPMVEVDATLEVMGPDGPVPFLEVFEGRRELVAYFHMWFDGLPTAEQCEGCTFFNGQVRELSAFHARDVTYATLCEGPYDVSVRYRDFMGWEVPWYSVRDSAAQLLTGRKPDMFHLVCYLRDGDRVFETYWTNGRGVEAMAPAYAMLDLTVYGRREGWQDTPVGWPAPVFEVGDDPFRTHGRPAAQWSRLAAGRSDDLADPPGRA